MKKVAIILSSFLITYLSSCGNGACRVGKGTEIIMIGNKPYKMVYITVDGNQVTTIVPADSSVTVIPFITSYQAGKVTQTTIKVD